MPRRSERLGTHPRNSRESLNASSHLRISSASPGKDRVSDFSAAIGTKLISV